MLLLWLRRSAVALVATALPLLPSASARAFCRATSAEPISDCECAEEGLPLYWARDTISYALNQRGFPGLREQTVREVLAASFTRWTEVECDGEPVVLSAEQLAATTPMTKEHLKVGANLNVFVHLSAAEFGALGGDPHAFALTSTYLDTLTGEIIGADVLFNGKLGPFTICPSQGCPSGSTDLENVATHEIGHFFGLGHSDVEDATMECAATPQEVKKRSLEDDDRAGICSIYAAPVVEERVAALRGSRDPGGCQLAGASSAPLAAGLLALCALALRRAAAGRRRRADDPTRRCA